VKKAFLLALMYEETGGAKIPEVFGLDVDRDQTLSDTLLKRMVKTSEMVNPPTATAVIMDFLQELPAAEQAPFAMTAFCAYYCKACLKIITEKESARAMKEALEQFLKRFDETQNP
jgi:hypothetical protein